MTSCNEIIRNVLHNLRGRAPLSKSQTVGFSREQNSNTIKILFDFIAPLHRTNFRLIPYGFALNLNDVSDFKTLIREDTHASFTYVKGCTFLTRFRVIANNTRHAHTESSLISSSLLWYFNHFSIPRFFAPFSQRISLIKKA